MIKNQPRNFFLEFREAYAQFFCRNVAEDYLQKKWSGDIENPS